MFKALLDLFRRENLIDQADRGAPGFLVLLPGDPVEALRERGERPTPNRHNCSGKHTGMIAFARMLDGAEGGSTGQLPYIDPSHRIQKDILSTFARMCDLPVDQVSKGTDGCSAPIFSP